MIRRGLPGKIFEQTWSQQGPEPFGRLGECHASKGESTCRGPGGSSSSHGLFQDSSRRVEWTGRKERRQGWELVGPSRPSWRLRLRLCVRGGSSRVLSREVTWFGFSCLSTGTGGELEPLGRWAVGACGRPDAVPFASWWRRKPGRPAGSGVGEEALEGWGAEKVWSKWSGRVGDWVEKGWRNENWYGHECHDYQ